MNETRACRRAQQLRRDRIKAKLHGKRPRIRMTTEKSYIAGVYRRYLP